jgi:hypothetical protein
LPRSLNAPARPRQAFHEQTLLGFVEWIHGGET